MKWNKDKTIQIISNSAQLDAVNDSYLNAEYLAVDTETTGLQQFCTMIGISMAKSEDEALYIPYYIFDKDKGLISPWNPEALVKINEFIIKQLTHKKRLIGHNSPFDAKAIRNTIGIEVINYFKSDTCLLHHTVINEEPPHGLKDLAAQYLDEGARTSQDDLRDSVIANGGRWVKDTKEMYKGDWKLLANYCCYDSLFTFGLHNRFYPEIEKQGLNKLWHEEVLPLNAVTYELNTTGLCVDVPYFEKLKVEMEQKTEVIEDEIYAQVEDRVFDYELAKMFKDLTLTSRSEIGKLLIQKGFKIDDKLKSNPDAVKIITSWYKTKNSIRRIFNFDSGADKAYLIFDVLGLPCEVITDSGKRSITATVLEDLANKYAEDSPVLKMIMDRSSELKLLSTYVIPILQNHIDGRIYPNFNQTGTTSGRYSSSGGLNFQTLPRDDKRIKKGFVADEGSVFVNADFSSLEPRSFAHVSSEDSIKAVYTNGLDLYSQVAIKVQGLTGVSSREGDKNFLKDVDPKARQTAKVITLAIPYGAGVGRIAQILNMDYEDAKDLYNRYMQAFPKLKDYMSKCEFLIKKQGFVTNLIGRKRRAKLVPRLLRDYGVKDFTKKELMFKFKKFTFEHTYEDSDAMYFACRNELNNAKNFPIQSLAAAIANASCVELKEKILKEKLNAKIVLQIHDEICILSEVKDAKRIAELLQESMERNKVTKLLSVPMKAEPVIATNLAEAK
jgi:DNA polymerase-1